MKRLSLFIIFLCAGLSLCAQNIDVRKHVEYLTSDSLMGRKAGSDGELAAAKYIYRTLEDYGVEMLTPEDGEPFSYFLKTGDTVSSRNVYGVISGYDPELKNEYVLIGAHMDHLGFNRLDVDGHEEFQIYRGADDNASGIAALLETARIIARQKYLFRRSVIIAAFGAEEYGMIGSFCFLNGPFKDTSNIVLMVNLDMVGRSGSDNEFRAFTCTRAPILDKLLDSTSSGVMGAKPTVYPTDYFPSDHRTFYHRNIPAVLFTTGTHRDYHTIRDTPEKLDYARIRDVAIYTFAFTKGIAGRDGRIPLPAISSDMEQKNSVERLYTQNEVDKRAEFLHGDENQFLSRWVYPYLKYPEAAIARGEQGKVVAEFIVEADGSVTNVAVVSGVCNEIDEEVIKVITASPKWKPAKLHGNEVRVKCSVVVEFKLSQTSRFGIKK